MRPLLALTTSFALLAAGPALAQERTLSAKDLDTYARLHDARALAETRRSWPGGSREASEKEFQRALAAAGWDQERFDQARDLVDAVLSYVDTQARDPEEARTFWEAYEPVDAATIQRVKARKAELEGAEQRAEAALRDERNAGVLGRLATAADLQGTWKRDVALTRRHLVAVMHLPEAQADGIARQVEQTLTFSGNEVRSQQVVNGKKDDWKGTFTLAGRDLKFTVGGRTESLQVGVKGPGELVLGMMGIPSGVYRKQ